MTEQQFDPLQDKIRDFKEKHPDPDPVVDVLFILDALDSTPDGSKLWAAVDCIVEKEWQTDVPKYGISGVRTGDDGKLIFHANSSGVAKETYVIRNAALDCLNGASGSGMKAAFEKGEPLFEITDVFGHVLLGDKLAGLPFDVVLIHLNKHI